VNNTIARNEAVVQKGHERVLRARLADAGFFFKEDRKKHLEGRLEDLKAVIYQAQLGTSYDKVERFARLAEYLAAQILPEKIDEVRCAARLCKCDLVTEMVMEFPSLQGVIGEIYARLDGHSEEICRAISDHYLPNQADSDLPESMIGSIVGMADRMDTIVGFFAIGREPTGTADPYALRRQTLAIIRLIRDKKITVRIGDFVNEAARILGETLAFDAQGIRGKVLSFIKDRFKNMLLAEGFDHDLIDAALTADIDYLHEVEERITALKTYREVDEGFEPLVMTFKRIANIVKGYEGRSRVKVELFDHESEENLWEAFQRVKDKVEKEMGHGNYSQGLRLIAGLNGAVNEFFTAVMVMAEDEDIRENRLGLLREVYSLFVRLADFSKFTV
jgi:glycyl-tRNA synthetase beta chain